MENIDRKKMRTFKALSYIKRNILPKQDILYLLQVEEKDLKQHQSEFNKLTEEVV